MDEKQLQAAAALGFRARCTLSVKRGMGERSGVRVGGVFFMECYDKHGNLKWRDPAKNLVTNAGLQHILDSEFGGDTQVTTWYVGLTAGSPTPAAGDTLASHAGWTEFSNYSGDRKEWVEVRSGQTMSNSASKAQFSITGGTTVGGAFLCSAVNGTSGTLMCVAASTEGNRTVANGDTLNIQYDFSAADDGA